MKKKDIIKKILAKEIVLSLLSEQDTNFKINKNNKSGISKIPTALAGGVLGGLTGYGITRLITYLTAKSLLNMADKKDKEALEALKKLRILERIKKRSDAKMLRAVAKDIKNVKFPSYLLGAYGAYKGAEIALESKNLRKRKKR